MLTSLIFAGLTMLPPSIEERASLLEELNNSRGVATIESLNIPWESGDIMEASALPAPEPEPEPEPVAEEPASRSVETRETVQEVASQAEVYETSSAGIYSLADFKFMGIAQWGGTKWSWYSQKVLPGPGLAVNNHGRHVNSNGFIADGDGYLVIAAPPGIAHGTIFETPFGGPGKVWDTCASCTGGSNGGQLWLDMYVD